MGMEVIFRTGSLDFLVLGLVDGVLLGLGVGDRFASNFPEDEGWQV